MLCCGVVVCDRTMRCARISQLSRKRLRTGTNRNQNSKHNRIRTHILSVYLARFSFVHSCSGFNCHLSYAVHVLPPPHIIHRSVPALPTVERSRINYPTKKTKKLSAKTSEDTIRYRHNKQTHKTNRHALTNTHTHTHTHTEIEPATNQKSGRSELGEVTRKERQSG